MKKIFITASLFIINQGFALTCLNHDQTKSMQVKQENLKIMIELKEKDVLLDYYAGTMTQTRTGKEVILFNSSGAQKNGYYSVSYETSPCQFRYCPDSMKKKVTITLNELGNEIFHCL